MWEVYVIYEGIRPIYCGRTSKGFHNRFKQHVKSSSLAYSISRGTFSNKEMHEKMKSKPQDFSIEVLARTDNLLYAMLMERQAVLTYKTHNSVGGYNTHYPSIKSPVNCLIVKEESKSSPVKFSESTVIGLIDDSPPTIPSPTPEKRRGPKAGKHHDRNLEIVRLRTEEKLSIEEISNRFLMHKEYIRQLLRKQNAMRILCSCGNLTNKRGNCSLCRKKAKEQKKVEREERKVVCSSCSKERTRTNTTRIGSDGLRRCSKCAYREDPVFREKMRTANRESRRKRLEKSGGIITPEERLRNLIAQKKYRDKKRAERESRHF